jgi:hypothetical protein
MLLLCFVLRQNRLMLLALQPKASVGAGVVAVHHITLH